MYSYMLFGFFLGAGCMLLCLELVTRYAWRDIMPRKRHATRNRLQMRIRRKD